MQGRSGFDSYLAMTRSVAWMVSSIASRISAILCCSSNGGTGIDFNTFEFASSRCPGKWCLMLAEPSLAEAIRPTISKMEESN